MKSRADDVSPLLGYGPHYAPRITSRADDASRPTDLSRRGKITPRRSLEAARSIFDLRAASFQPAPETSPVPLAAYRIYGRHDVDSDPKHGHGNTDAA